MATKLFKPSPAIRNARCLLATSVAVLITCTVTVGCSSGGTSVSPANDPLPVAADLDDVLTSAVSEFGFAGAIAGIWTPQGTWVGSVGTASVDSDDAITPHHHTRIGSITKTFTGTLLLQEVAKGTMSLSDPIEKYVPGLPNGDSVTLRDLAQMTSGIPSYTTQMPFLLDHYQDVDRSFTAEELLDYVRDTEPLFPAGSAFDYSNSNTVALGMAIERASGRSLDDLIAEQITGPLGMGDTSWPGLSPEIPAPFLSGQTTEGLPEGTRKDATKWNPSWGNAAGEMISTLDDLRIWGRALGTGEGILDPQSHRLRTASFVENLDIAGNSPDAVYGLGVGLIDGWIGHTGELAGYNTSVLHDPSTATTVVVVVNSNLPNDQGQNPAPTISERLRGVLAGT